jgi:hypothetical protein
MKRSLPHGQFERRLLTLTRGLAGFAIAFTGLCASALMAWQFYSWATAGSWNTVAFSDVLELADVSPPRTYTPASVTSYGAERERIDVIFEWLLNLPAIMPLLLALSLLTAFYVFLLSVEKELVQNQ